MNSLAPRPETRLSPRKFSDPVVTARGEPRAVVAPGKLRTLWINTGTLCNIACTSCYIESSPRNDALVYPTLPEILPFLVEARAMGVTQIGFTGGEPFLNRDLPAMLRVVLEAGLEALVLTNAMKPMRNGAAALLALRAEHGSRLVMRVSLDHHGAALHDLERGAGSFVQAMEGLAWLARHGFTLHVAGRAAFGGESEAELRAGYTRAFAEYGIPVDAADPVALMLFPEMDVGLDVPEISTGCWDILGKRPQQMMCASSRMVVKRRGAAAPVVVACTLLPHDPGFELGRTLAEAARPVALNHPHCARFCVLGGGACAA
ncbi:radical SAM protein [Falsiroseomonas sp. HC035]|uniref:radical SAM protein n=1 Tax=Falsiroseomonas sp. HC035 TaxID=3390999 RepID=UPI003D31B88B